MTMEAPAAAPRQAVAQPGQWRLDRIELVNWGTFDGHHALEVPRSGFLLTGHSGSGKSSLVDAITAVLTPRMRATFNAAAADGSSRGNDRTVLTYVRGAHSRGTDSDTGEITTQYLRPAKDATGKETGGTWSGLLLRYSSGTGKHQHLVKLFHAKRGASVPADVSELHMITAEDIELLDLQPYAINGLKERELKKAHPQAYVHKQHSRFAARFSRELGNLGERATVLLHRTQAAKNLGSLDDLFRDFMLDEPETYVLADRAVEQFTELSEAHRAVVRAREQIGLLQPLEPAAAQYEAAVAEQQQTEQLNDALEDFTHTWKVQLTEQAQQDAAQTSSEAEAAHTQTESTLAAADQTQRDAAAAVDARGGAQLEALEERISARRERLSAARDRHAQMSRVLADADLPTPENQAEMAQLHSTAEQMVTEASATAEQNQQQAQEVMARKAEAQQQLAGVDAELQALRKSRSNVGQRLLAARTLIAEAAGVPERSLPFAAELLQVRGDYADWTGAIERVLRPVAAVMLVPAAQEFAVSAAADAHHLGARLQFSTVPAESGSPAKPASEDSLIYRVEVSDTASSSIQGWLHHELGRRFDYPCVESAEQLGGLDRGVTRAGQVKRGPRTYEKDDTFEVTDRSRWVLGFGNEDKTEHFLALRRQLDEQITAIDKDLGAAISAQHAHRDRLRALQQVQSLTWDEVDAAARQTELQQAETARTTLLAGDGDLRRAQKQLQEAEQQRRAAADQEREAAKQLLAAQAELERLQRSLEQLRSTEVPALEAEVTAALEEVFASHRTQRSVTHASIDADARQVGRALNEQIRRSSGQQSQAAEQIARITFEFRSRWPAAAGDLSDGVETRADYLEVLQSLRADRLPDFEQRFFQMLRDQSQQNIGLLAERIRRAPTEIRRRVDPINESLMRSRFDHRGRWLQIQVKEARPAVAREFLADLNTIASGGLAIGEETAEQMEERFAVLARVMRQLGSSEAADRTWRGHCLDTRRHVQFLGLEKDAEGVVVDYHESGRGRSGGQKQKLVIFCLAAALRYQLTRETEETPSYGSIVMDEAFDKADARFTRMALDIFAEFGFHMILATPLKMLQVLEDYVGGIALVTSNDGMKSYASEVSIDDRRLGAVGDGAVGTGAVGAGDAATGPAAEHHREDAEHRSPEQNGFAEADNDQQMLFGDDT